MSVVIPASPVDVRPRLSSEDFYAHYVNNRPVVMRGGVAGLPAVSRWSLDHFASLAPDLPVRLKTGSVSEGRTTVVTLEEYRRIVAEWEAGAAGRDEAAEPPAYLHDLPLQSMIPALLDDLTGFPADLLPKFFRDRWWEFTQFFVGPSRAHTPLHFDSLLTHNIFLQVQGAKRFVMVDAEDRDRCYTNRWRWSPVDPDDPDLGSFPRFRGARVRECTVEAGDLLYMPPGTLHKVTSMTSSVSFNIDWHDPRSAVRGLLAVRDGMPAQNLRYNLLFALGIIGRVPRRLLMPGLESYFSYIS